MDNAHSDIGAILKAAREAMGISIANAAMQTNLSIAVLEKLEANQFAQIGAPVFTRGYLMQYSRLLNLDPETMAADFNRLGVKDSEIRLSSANVASQSRSFKRYHFGTWLGVAAIMGLAAVVLIQVFTPNSWLMQQFKQAFNKERAAELAQNDGQDKPLQTQITLQIGDTAEPPVVSTENSPPAGEPLPTLTSLPSEQNPTESTPNSALENEGSVLAANPSNVNDADANQTLSTEIANNENALTETQTESSEGIRLNMTSENWVEVRNKEHRIVVSKVHKAGDKIELPLADAPYEFNIGRPEAAQLFINGQAANLEPYRVGKSRRFKVSPNP